MRYETKAAAGSIFEHRPGGGQGPDRHSKEVRDLFEIEPGDSLLLMADKKRGIAIVGFDGMMDFMDESLRQGRAAQKEGST